MQIVAIEVFRIGELKGSMLPITVGKVIIFAREPSVTRQEKQCDIDRTHKTWSSRGLAPEALCLVGKCLSEIAKGSIHALAGIFDMHVWKSSIESRPHNPESQLLPQAIELIRSS